MRIRIAFLLLALLSLSISTAHADDIPARTMCDALLASLQASGGTTEATVTRFDPPADPHTLEQVLTSAETISPNPITGFTGGGTSDGQLINEVGAVWKAWAAGAQYFFYVSVAGANEWKCVRSYTNGSNMQDLAPDTDYDLAVIAKVGDTWSMPAFATATTRRVPIQVCPLSTFKLHPTDPLEGVNGFNAILNVFTLVISRVDSKSESTEERLKPERHLLYTVEYSIDNWKTKAVYQGLSMHGVALDESIQLKAIAKNKIHQFRAIPNASSVFVPFYVLSYNSVGCKPLTASFKSTETKVDPCSLGISGLDCPVVLVAGENAKTSKVVSIFCVKGKTTKKVTAMKPTCPKGYVKK